MTVPLIRIIPGGLLVDSHPIFPAVKGKPFFSIRTQWPQLKNYSLVIGFIGGRGSGKSTSAARTIVMDYLLKRKKVWSNMPVACDLTDGKSIAHLHSIDIEGGLDIAKCENGCIFLDEINQEYADAYRSQSTNSLEFSYETQQLRKSNLDLIWTTQSESFINPRLRFQTDIIIKCADLHLIDPHVYKGKGEYSLWDLYDYSGITSNNPNVHKLEPSQRMFIKPWWNMFDTTLKQKDKKEPAVAVDNRMELYSKAAEIASYVKDNDRVRILKIWSMFGIDDRKDQLSIIKLLGSEFDVFPNSRRDYFRFEKEGVWA